MLVEIPQGSDLSGAGNRTTQIRRGRAAPREMKCMLGVCGLGCLADSDFCFPPRVETQCEETPTVRTLRTQGGRCCVGMVFATFAYVEGLWESPQVMKHFQLLLITYYSVFRQKTEPSVSKRKKKKSCLKAAFKKIECILNIFAYLKDYEPSGAS